MSIDEAYNFCLYVANKQNGNITPANFNLLAPIAQMSVLNDRLGNVKKYRPHDPVPPYALGISQKSKEEIGKFLYISTSLSVTSGFVLIPAGILYLDAMTTGALSGVIVREVQADEFILLQSSAIRPPTVQKPVFMRVNGFFHFLPLSLTSAHAFYVKTPVTPLWNYTIVSGRPVYAETGGIIGSGNSQGFQMGETVHVEICAKILQAIGISLDQNSITQYAELQEQKGS